MQREFCRPEQIFSSIDYLTKCGVGICGACATPDGRRLCVDGPFLQSANDIIHPCTEAPATCPLIRASITHRWEKSFNRILTPLEEFIHRQTTSGILLMICTVIALVIANGPLHEQYEHLLHTEIGFSVGSAAFSLSLHHWINEALMALFFFIMGLELKRELLVGELSSPKQALLPIMAAIGGMVVPAVFYVAVNANTASVSGWGIPMATDIAFAVGALSLLGTRVPKSLVTFLIALAIVDDLGAVAVIALFYTDDLNLLALSYAGGCTLLLVILNLGGIRHALPYAIVGVLLWAAMLASGVHSTIAGIVVAFVIPIRPKFQPEHFIDRVKESARQTCARRFRITPTSSTTAACAPWCRRWVTACGWCRPRPSAWSTTCTCRSPIW